MDLLSARAAQWRAGLRSELLSNSTVTQPSSRINRSLSPQTKFYKTVQRAAAEGSLSRAAILLIQGQPLQCEAGSVQCLKEAMEALHPTETVQSPPDVPIDDQAIAQASEIVTALKSFLTGTAAGPSGLRASHLHECLFQSGDAQVEQRLLSLVVEFVLFVISDKMPAQVAVLLGGARLLPVPKSANAYRPIAIGETLRRLVGKVIVQIYGPILADDLAPEQFGVCRPGGMEAIIHDVNYWFKTLSQQNGCCILQLDFRNAFNTLSRGHILSLLKHCPDCLRHYANFFCNGPLPLYGPGFQVTSSTGVQQGDPCGPLLFSLGIHPLLRQLSALDINVRFYLDDGILYGKPESLAEALDLINAFGVKTNLVLNVSKC